MASSSLLSWPRPSFFMRRKVIKNSTREKEVCHKKKPNIGRILHIKKLGANTFFIVERRTKSFNCRIFGGRILACSFFKKLQFFYKKSWNSYFSPVLHKFFYLHLLPPFSWSPYFPTFNPPLFLSPFSNYPLPPPLSEDGPQIRCKKWEKGVDDTFLRALTSISQKKATTASGK